MENAPGEGGRRVQNEGPEGSWELLGAMWVGPGWPPGVPQIALGGGPGAARRPKKIMWRLLGASWGGKLIDFSFQEAGQERRLPESLPESIFEASFLAAPPGTNNV